MLEVEPAHLVGGLNFQFSIINFQLQKWQQ